VQVDVEYFMPAATSCAWAPRSTSDRGRRHETCRSRDSSSVADQPLAVKRAVNGSCARLPSAIAIVLLVSSSRWAVRTGLVGRRDHPAGSR